jgi:hypothetical protein
MRHWAKHILAAGVAAALGGCTAAPAHDAQGAARPADTAQAPAPPAPASQVQPASEVGTIADGSNLALGSGVRLCTGVSKAGDAFTATVTGSVIGSHGAVIPVGSVVVGHVVDARDSLVLAFDSLAIGTQSYPIAARMVGSPQTTTERPRLTGGFMRRPKVICVPEHGRMTIQLTADLPLQ